MPPLFLPSFDWSSMGSMVPPDHTEYPDNKSESYETTDCCKIHDFPPLYVICRIKGYLVVGLFLRRLLAGEDNDGAGRNERGQKEQR